MAEITIRFRHNPKTGKREIVIGYESESDALPHEHERDHRAMVQELLGIDLDDDDDDVVVERLTKGETREELEPDDTPRARTPQEQGQG